MRARRDEAHEHDTVGGHGRQRDGGHVHAGRGRLVGVGGGSGGRPDEHRHARIHPEGRSGAGQLDPETDDTVASIEGERLLDTQCRIAADAIRPEHAGRKEELQELVGGSEHGEAAAAAAPHGERADRPARAVRVASIGRTVSIIVEPVVADGLRSRLRRRGVRDAPSAGVAGVAALAAPAVQRAAAVVGVASALLAEARAGRGHARRGVREAPSAGVAGVASLAVPAVQSATAAIGVAAPALLVEARTGGGHARWRRVGDAVTGSVAGVAGLAVPAHEGGVAAVVVRAAALLAEARARRGHARRRGGNDAVVEQRPRKLDVDVVVGLLIPDEVAIHLGHHVEHHVEVSVGWHLAALDGEVASQKRRFARLDILVACSCFFGQMVFRDLADFRVAVVVGERIDEQRLHAERLVAVVLDLALDIQEHSAVRTAAGLFLDEAVDVGVEPILEQGLAVGRLVIVIFFVLLFVSAADGVDALLRPAAGVGVLLAVAAVFAVHLPAEARGESRRHRDELFAVDELAGAVVGRRVDQAVIGVDRLDVWERPVPRLDVREVRSGVGELNHPHLGSALHEVLRRFAEADVLVRNEEASRVVGDAVVNGAGDDGEVPCGTSHVAVRNVVATPAPQPEGVEGDLERLRPCQAIQRMHSAVGLAVERALAVEVLGALPAEDRHLVLVGEDVGSAPHAGGVEWAPREVPTVRVHPSAVGENGPSERRLVAPAGVLSDVVGEEAIAAHGNPVLVAVPVGEAAGKRSSVTALLELEVQVRPPVRRSSDLGDLEPLAGLLTLAHDHGAVEQVRVAGADVVAVVDEDVVSPVPAPEADLLHDSVGAGQYGQPFVFGAVAVEVPSVAAVGEGTVSAVVERAGRSAEMFVAPLPVFAPRLRHPPVVASRERQFEVHVAVPRERRREDGAHGRVVVAHARVLVAGSVVRLPLAVRRQRAGVHQCGHDEHDRGPDQTVALRPEHYASPCP